ncbi:MAG: DedA family protein [Actinomycetota bacterium]|nr:DedA family protein [Actinomycetota bacterium]
MHEITDALTSWIGSYGVYAIFALSVVDAVLPAASELVMVYAGALAIGAFPGQEVTLFGDPVESTSWAFVTVALAGALGYGVGAVVGWAIGLYGGRPYLERHGRWLHVTPHDLDRAESWFDRYGGVAVLVSRCIPVVRSFISIPAGVAEMPLPRYALLTLLGTLPWYFGLAAAGLALGSGWERFHEAFRYADYAVVALAVVAVLVVVVRARQRRSRRRALERPAQPADRA